MNIKHASRVLLVAVGGTLSSMLAQAEGTVSFLSDIVPVMKTRPSFENFITQSFSVVDAGWGVRINSPTMPHMGGARMGPYRFNAIWHSKKGDVPVTLLINTRTQFFDDRHKEIMGDDLRKATFIKETLDSIEVESPGSGGIESK